jgi:hypothetical protein
MQPFFLLQTDDSIKLIAIALGGFALIYIVVLRPMVKKKKDPLERSSPSSPIMRGLGQQRGLEREMQNLLVEYERMIRNMTAGLDTRAAKLEVLLHEADEKLAAMRAANSGMANPSFRRADPAPGGEDETLNTLRTEQAAALDTPSFDPRHADVYALADQGLSAKAVARKLGRPDGEIELILALRSGIE